MAEPSELFFKLVRQIQQYRRKIDPVLDVMERAGLLLDRLEQAEQAKSKITRARLILDAIDDSLKDGPNLRITKTKDPGNEAGMQNSYENDLNGSGRERSVSQ